MFVTFFGGLLKTTCNERLNFKVLPFVNRTQRAIRKRHSWPPPVRGPMRLLRLSAIVPLAGVALYFAQPDFAHLPEAVRPRVPLSGTL